MIVKYCNRKFNAHSGAKLLIGNLEKYRDIENAELKDVGEGTFKFSIEFLEGAELPIAWVDLLFQGSIGFGGSSGSIRLPGEMSTYVEELCIQQDLGDRVIFDYAKVDIEYSALNSYIFCASMTEGSPLESNPFKEYDDFWVAGKNRAAIDKFAARVGNLLFDQLSLSSFNCDTENVRLSELKNIRINVRHAPVNYMDRKIVIGAGFPQDAAQLIQHYLDVPFCKPSEFRHEREYRFIFTPVVGNRILPVKKEDIFLDLNALTAP